MKVSCHIACSFLLLVLLNNVRGEYRYKIRGPPPPPPKPLQPRPPIPHFSNKPFSQATAYFPPKNKWPLSLSTGSRVVPGLRGTQQYQFLPQGPHYLWNGPQHSFPQLPVNHHGPRAPFQFQGPNLIPPTNTKLPPSLSYPFRVPGVKEPFFPLTLSEYDYQPPKISLPIPQPPVVPHIDNAIDDDKGPIHTIPAPNLNPNSNTNHNVYVQQHDLGGFSKPLPQPQVTVQQSHGYEVREVSNDQAGHTVEGVPTYYAPDPDPSLPAPKIPATTDPHSLPSNGKVNLQTQQPPQQVQTLQILDTNGGGISNQLSSQELYELFHTAQQPQQQSVDSYGIPLQQQPQLQHYQQQNTLFPQSNFLNHVSQDNINSHQGEFIPDYQSFNYQEKYRNAGDYPEQDGSENVPAITVLRNSPEATLTSHHNEQESNSLTEDGAYYDNAATNIASEDYEESSNDDNRNDSKAPTSYLSQIDDGNGALSTSYYTTLPNREAAETLATLAAAGSINTHLANHLKNEVQDNRTPAPEEEEVVEEEEVEYEEEDEPEVTPAPPSTQPPQISKPIVYQTQRESDTSGSTRYPNSGIRQHQRRPTIPNRDKTNENSDNVDYDSQGTRQSDTEFTNEDVKGEAQQKPSNVQFGARIRPKRNK